jgi:tetratricopeptide (TPR) repeat protein
LIPLLVVAAGLLAYHNSFSGPFIFDDLPSVRNNWTIRHLWPVWNALAPPHWRGTTVEGRPVLNLTLAVNYALGGYAVRGYHVGNLAIHVLAGLTLFGIVRRTLRQPALRERFGAAANELALATAVLWTVHPLQTESVTYLSQRAESLMGFVYLLTLYCFIRGTASPSAGLWFTLSIVGCLLGMATKEVMVSAPLMVLLYDRTFVSGSFREAWRRRRSLYLALGSTWILLAYLVAAAGGRGGSAGFGVKIIWWQYALTQTCAIMHYLWLSVWPHPLVFDYGTDVITDAWQVTPCAVTITLLVIGTAISLWRWPVVGFVACWFFAILAPSSSILPVATQTVAEHRMYLPLAAVVVLAVMGIHDLVGRRTVAVMVLLAIALGALTWRRNQDYCSDIAIWDDTVAKWPENPRAQEHLGVALGRTGRLPEAIEHLEQALRIEPDYAEAHCNLGATLGLTGRLPEAIEHLERALRIRPDYAEAHCNLGNVFFQEGKVSDAIGHFEQALRSNPDYAEAQYNLGLALARLGRLQEAVGHWEQALRIEPDYAEAHCILGVSLGQAGKTEDAIGHYEQALRIKPDYSEAHYNLGIALYRTGRRAEAMEHFQQAVRIKPDYAEAQNSLGTALAQTGRIEEAIAHYEQALRINPDLAEVHYNLGNALAQAGRVPEAIAQYEQALRIKPDFTPAQNALARLQAGQ